MAEEKRDSGALAEAAGKLRGAFPDELGEKTNIDEGQAEAAAEATKPVIDDARYDRLQDHAGYELARDEEARGQGTVKTTQEGLRDLARQEEANGQGLESVADTTQKRLFREARKDEVDSQYREQAAHGVVEPTTIGPGGIDQVALDEDERKQTAEDLEKQNEESQAQTQERAKQRDEQAQKGREREDASKTGA